MNIYTFSGIDAVAFWRTDYVSLKTTMTGKLLFSANLTSGTRVAEFPLYVKSFVSSSHVSS